MLNCPIPLVEDLIPAGRRNRPPGLMKPEWVTVHDTGNPNKGASARNHALYLKGDTAANAPVSWHFTVDDQGAHQHLPLDEHGWHAGDGRGPGNATSIGIEICENTDGNRPQAEDNAAALIAWLMLTLGLSLERVVTHQHWYPGKYCPHLLLPRWSQFKDLIQVKMMDPGFINGTSIIGPAQATVEQAQAWARARQGTARYISVAPLYWKHGTAYGLRPEVAYAQAAKETGFGRFGGAVTPDMHNWCGVKVRAPRGDAREDHAAFPDDDTGVHAHFQHLAAYVGIQPIGEIVDLRYELVKGLPWAGTVKTVEGLGGKWAPNPAYGTSIVKDYLEPLLATEVEGPNLEEIIAALQMENQTLKDRLTRIAELANIDPG